MLIRIYTGKVRSATTKVTSITNRVNIMSSNIVSVRRRLDYEIRYKYIISNGFDKVEQKLRRITYLLNETSNFMDSATSKYEECEKKVLKNDKDFTDKVEKKSGWSFDDIYKEIRNFVIGFNPRDFLMTGIIGGLKFKFINKDGSLFLKLINKKVTNNRSFQKISSEFTTELGGSTKWRKKFLEDLSNGDGIKLIDSSGRKKMGNINKFKNSNFEELADGIKSSQNLLSKGKLSNMAAGAKKSFGDSFKFWDDFKPSSWKGVTKGVKVTKGLGILGTVLTVGENFQDNFKKDNGEFEFSGENTKSFIVDSTVDIAAGAGAAAVGGAAGSLFLPPIGTVVGAAVGFGVGCAINGFKVGDPPGSLVDKAKDGANFVVDSIGKGVSSLCSNVGEKLEKIFW